MTCEVYVVKAGKATKMGKKEKTNKAADRNVFCKKESWWLTRQKHFVTWLHCKSDGPADCDVWLLIYQLVLLLYAVRSRVRLILEFQVWRSNLSTTLISALHLQNEVIKKCQWQCCWKASLSYAAGIAHLQTYNLKKLQIDGQKGNGK